jgi:hypothetical protein
MPQDDSLHEKVGFLRSDVKNVEQKLDKISDQVVSVGNKIVELDNTTIKHTQCATQSAVFASKIDELKKILKTKQTKEDHQSVTAITKLVSDQLYKAKQGRTVLEKIKENATTITVIIGMVSILIIGLIKFAKFVVNFENSLKITEQLTTRKVDELKTEVKYIRHLEEAKPNIVYIPIHPDAGIAPRRHRRRPRRIRGQ